MTRKEQLVKWHKQKNNLGVARCGINLSQMNTIARVGKTVLKTLFSKMNVFGELKIDIGSLSIDRPKLPEKKEIILPDDSPEMEDGGYKAYQGKTRGCTKREDRCKIFTWSATIGLVEIPLDLFKKEDTLFGMICRIHIQLKPRGYQMMFRTPTHIIIARNNKWLKYDDKDGPTLGNILAQDESETIYIYSIEQVWQQMIWDTIATFKLTNSQNTGS